MHRLSLKIALLAAIAFFLASLIAGSTLGAGPSIRDAAVLALGSGSVCYLAAHLMLARRLAKVRWMLGLIREHRFEELGAQYRDGGDELDRLLQQANRTGAAVEREFRDLEKMENYRREFIGNVSHELKTPIFAVQGFAETLLDGALEDENVRRSFVEKILRNAARLGNLARDLSDISRIETGDLRLKPTAFSLGRLLREVSESLEGQARERDVHLQFTVPEWLPPAWADREAVRQILLNLVDNAIKYNEPGGRVELIARKLDDQNLRVSIADNGIGIEPDDLPRVTERFFRVDKSRSRAQGGTGLGLAIVKHLLAAHDRRLVVESTPGKGSTFGFTLAIGSADQPPTTESGFDRHRS